MRQIIYTPKAAKPPATYSQAVKAAGLVFVSGTAPHDPVPRSFTWYQSLFGQPAKCELDV